MAANRDIEIDAISPTVALSASVSSPTIETSFTVTVTFSKEVIGFSVMKLTVSNCLISNFQQDSATVYSFTVSPAKKVW